MRNTSPRRRGGQDPRRAHAYTGHPGTPIQHDPPKLVVEPDSEDAIECPHCHVFLKATKAGRIPSHAAGGYGTSTKKARYTCPGVELPGVQPVPLEADHLPVIDIVQKRRQRLMSSREFAERLDMNLNYVRAWLRGHVMPVARIPQAPGYAYLFDPQQVFNEMPQTWRDRLDQRKKED